MNKQNLAHKAALLHLQSLSLARGMRSGSFRSLYRGQGIEFGGVRDYLIGDDVRSIDWNVTSRMGRPFIKLYDEERELNVFIVLDKSLSMTTGSGRQSRMETAVECASLLTLASEKNASPVGAVIFDGKINFSCSPKSGKDQSLLLLSEFEKQNDKKVCGSALDNALLGAGRLLKKKTLIVVISDFRTDGWLSSFGALCNKNDVVALCITDPLDEYLPNVGSITVSDPETEKQAVLATGSSAFRRKWRDDNAIRIKNWKSEVVRHGGIPLTVSTAQDPSLELIRFFASRERI